MVSPITDGTFYSESITYGALKTAGQNIEKKISKVSLILQSLNFLLLVFILSLSSRGIRGFNGGFKSF